MNLFYSKVKRQSKFVNSSIAKKIEKTISTKQFFRFSVLEEYLALLNNEYIYVYNTKNGKIMSITILKQSTRYSKLNLYFFRLIRFQNSLMLLFVYTDRIAIIFENRLIFQLKINEPLYRYENFYYDPLENYFIIQGTTMADNFSLFIVSKLFQKQKTIHFQTPHLIRLSLNYSSIYYETNMMFKQLKNNYLSIHSICILPGHRLFLYNKEEKELYLCDLQELCKIYPTSAYLDDYEYSIFKIDKSQNCLPFQAIVGVYGKVYAQAIKHHRNHLILIQERDPISELVWEEQYAIEDDRSLRYVTRNKRTERYREE